MKHTSTPWAVSLDPVNSPYGNSLIIQPASEKAGSIGICWGKGNAEFIVNAANEHAALVAVAEAAHGLMMTPGVEKFDVAHYKVAKAISTLAAVRAGHPAQLPQDQVLVEALMQIASWGEGDEVDGSFDEPCAAKAARAALAKIGIVGGFK